MSITIGGIRKEGFITIGGEVVAIPSAHAPSHGAGAADVLPLSQDKILSGNGSGKIAESVSEFAVVFGISGATSVTDSVAALDAELPFKGKPLRWKGNNRTAPITSDDEFELVASDDGTTDPPVMGTDVITQGNMDFLATKRRGGGSGVEDVTLPEGTTLRLDCKAIGSGGAGEDYFIEVTFQRLFV